MNDEQQFLDVIDAADAWRPIGLALADWLEERGDPRSAGWRWLVQENREPKLYPSDSHLYRSSAIANQQRIYSWTWADDHHYLNRRIYFNTTVPRTVYNARENKTYSTKSAALSDAAQAAVKWLSVSAVHATRS